MKKLISLLILLLFIPFVKAENFTVTFMNSTFPSSGTFDCTIASNGKFYCSGPRPDGVNYNAFYEYDSENDTLKIIYNYTGYQKEGCIARPYRQEILCVMGRTGCSFVLFLNNFTGRDYCMPYNSWIVCNNTGYSNTNYYGGKCFLNVLHWGYTPYVEVICAGGKAYSGYPWYKDRDVCDLLHVFWIPSDNVVVEGINVEPDYYKWGHSCASYKFGETVCLGGNISHEDAKIVNASIVERFRITPNYWFMSCVSPNLVSYYTAKNYSTDVYCIGGYDWNASKPLNKIFKYSNNNFVEIANLSFTIYQTSCQPDFEGNIFCFGGIINGSYSNKIIKLSTYVPPPPPPPPPKIEVCRPCDYSQLNPKRVIDYVYIGVCLVLNLILCTPLYSALAFLVIFIFCSYIWIRKKYFS